MIICLWAGLILSQAAIAGEWLTPFGGFSPIPEPYSTYLGVSCFDGPAVAESPDPLVAYRWPDPKASDELSIYLVRPRSVSADKEESFENLQSLTNKNPAVTVKASGTIIIDFGRELPAWVEFDSPDCPGGVEMSISEYNEPGVNKTGVPVQHDKTWRLELNQELYDGVRFAWIKVKSADKPWHITGIRAVCQVKPTNYNGSFSCSDSMLTKIWYMCAYSVRAAYCKNYFGAILMERGDRISWTGDAHISQGASFVAFGNYDFIKRNLDNTAKDSNGIKSYALYWVLSLLDYYNYTGDGAAMNMHLINACGKLDDAYKVYGTNPKLRFYGWDDRLCAGFEIWFRGDSPEAHEAQIAYKMLSIRAWKDFAAAMDRFGRADLRDKYNGYAGEKMAELRKNSGWLSEYGIHSAADAINTGLLSNGEQADLFGRLFQDRVNRVSLAPFNQYFIIQAMARMNKIDEALTSMRDMWGGMIRYGGTTTFETYRPSWNAEIGMNDAVPNTQSGMTSLCCPWGAGPVKWLNEEVLGIVPTTPGFKTYDILPHPGRTLTWVAGNTPTPFGEISAGFDVTSGDCAFSAPTGTIGRIGIPKVEKKIRRILINGKLAWDGVFHPLSGVGAASEDSEFVCFSSVQPGRYEISVSYSGKTPPYNEPPEKYAAKFVKQDTTTGGNWGGVYGKDGYVLCNYDGNGKDRKSLPPYVKSIEYYRAFPKSGLPDPVMWEKGTTDRTALSPDSGNAAPRNAACICNVDQTMTATINVNGTREYQIALYFVDWGNKGRRHAVEMFDAETLNLIAPVKVVKNSAGGVYLVYSYNKSVKFRFDKVRGDIVTLSGIFFDSRPATGK